MAICGNCGANVEGAFCPICGAGVAAAEPVAYAPEAADGFDAKDAEENKVMGILSYLGFLVLVPFLTKKDSPFAQYHAKQGINLFIVEIAYIILNAILGAIKFTRTEYILGIGYPVSYRPWFIGLFTWLLSLGILALVVIGILNVVNGRKKELPLIGKIKIIK